jgi:hypothetical protein
VAVLDLVDLAGSAVAARHREGATIAARVSPHDISPGSTFTVRVASWSRKPVMSSVANNSCCNSAAAELATADSGIAKVDSGSDMAGGGV